MVSPTNADAYGIKRTKTGEVVHWESPNVHIIVDSSITNATPEANRAIQKAMTGWSGAEGAPSLTLAPTQGETDPGFDNRNVIMYKPRGYKPAGRALAITVLTYDDTTGKVLDADIIFNGAYKFAMPENIVQTAEHDVETEPQEEDEAASLESRTYDFEHVAVHELGHTMGLSDETSLPEAVMYRYSAPDVPLSREPHDDDLAGLAELYQSSAGTTPVQGQGGCGGSTISPREPTHLAKNFAALFAIGLGFWLTMRTGRSKKAAMGALASGALVLVAALPSVKAARGEAARGTMGHATAEVVRVSSAVESGILRSQVALKLDTCRVAYCPTQTLTRVWGGRKDGIVQQVGNYRVVDPGEHVEVTFANAQSGLRPLVVVPTLARDVGAVTIR